MNDARPGRGESDPTETFSDPGRDSFERLAEDFAERCRRGESHSISDYESRYPEHAERIRKLLPTVALMEQLKRASRRERREEPGSGAPPERLGEFRVVRELGRGGMGVVYEAVQESLGRHVALKVIHDVRLDARRLQRFRREAQAVARLHHSHIVPIFGVGEHEGLPYYVMQYIEGSGLDALVETWRREAAPGDASRWRFVANLGMQAAEAIGYAHDQGILHRDIKPANILIDARGTAWITDFGLAKLAGHDDLTASGDVVGTLRYLAPESLQGETDHRSDLYSLGLTLYELLTLTAPFQGLSASELLRHVNEEQPTRPRKLAPAIPRDLETIVLKAIARDPAHRYPTAAALAGDLQRFLEDRPILARRATPIERLWRWSRRNRLAATMAATAAAAVLLAVATGWAGYVITARALHRADQNVALSLDVFGELFEQLVSRDPLSTPPLGEAGGPPPPGSPGDEVPSPPPGRGGDAFASRPPPPRDRPGGPGAPPGGRPPGPPPRGDQEEDTALLRSVLTFYERFAGQNATNPRLEGEAAWAYRKVGALYERLGRAVEAERAYEHAIATFEGLVARYPKDPEYRAKLVGTYDMADPESADPATLARVESRLRRARELIDRLAREAPEDVDYGSLRARVYVKLGATLHRLGRPDEAAASYREAIAFEGETIERSPGVAGTRIDRASTREALARIELERGRRAEARTLLDAAVADLRVLRERDPDAPPLHSRLRSLAVAFEGLGEPGRAGEVARMADEDDARPHRPPPGAPGRRP